MTTHGAFTERSRITPIGKGREGKGDRNGVIQDQVSCLTVVGPLLDLGQSA